MSEMKVTYLTRQEWGADTALPRLGHIVSPDERTEVFIHHTVAVDNDATPNIWETMAEVVWWMRRLQTIRPDLGLDVPYNFVAFFMPSELVICEGRGANRSGAHTIGHNRSAIGLGVHGNFQLPTFGLDGYVKAMGPWLYQLKVSLLPFLGTKHPPGRDVYGHRDSGAQTACPGSHLYARLDDIEIAPPEKEDSEMALVRMTGDSRVFVFDGTGFRHIPSGKAAAAAYGSNWVSQVKDVSDKNDADHPFGNAHLPVTYPKGDPS